MVTEVTMKLLYQACTAAVPRRSANTRKRPDYWWTTETADLRRNCNRVASSLVVGYVAVKYESVMLSVYMLRTCHVASRNCENRHTVPSSRDE